MTINFDVVMDTPDYSVDMKAGLESLQGTSEVIRTIGQTVLTGKVPERRTFKNTVRTQLKASFSGSYGQIFSLELYDENLKKRMNKIGRAAFVELVTYYIHEATYQVGTELSDRALAVVKELGPDSDKLTKQLRVSAAKRMHEVPLKFDHDIKIRYRRNRDDQTILAILNRDSAFSLSAKIADRSVDLSVGITRLNTRTGNGRLQIEDTIDTIPFGFIGTYRAINIHLKKHFSENLDLNHGVEPENWTYLNIAATPIQRPDGKVIKYLIKAVYVPE